MVHVFKTAGDRSTAKYYRPVVFFLWSVKCLKKF